MKSTDSKHTLDVTTPSDREIVMTRVFDAPQTIIFDALTKPELIRRWLLGPPGWSMPVCDVDLKVGGGFHYVWRNDAGDNEFGLSGVYHEIAAPGRIVHVEKFDQEWYEGKAHVTTTLAERNGSTTLTMTILHDSLKARNEALESGMTTGVEASYGRLEEVLAAEG